MPVQKLNNTPWIGPDSHRPCDAGPAVKPAYVPNELLSAFQWKFRGKFTPLKTIFSCICIDFETWVGAVGDGDNAAYEYFIFSASSNKLEVSDLGYGSPDIALRDALNREAPPEKPENEMTLSLREIAALSVALENVSRIDLGTREQIRQIEDRVKKTLEENRIWPPDARSLYP